jgi:DNA-binding transcriptional LysR family regulator
MSDQLAALRLFVRVARTGSFSRAARELDISQPSASRAIAALEKEGGAALFTRSTRALALTEAGTRYLERIEPLLDALVEADHELRGTGELRGVLRVGLSSSLAVRAIIPALPRFAEQHPGLRIELLIDDRRQDLIDEGVDVALRFGPIADSTAVARKLMSIPRVIAASRAYLVRAGTPRMPDDLATHRAIIGVTGAGAGWTFKRPGHDDVTVHVDGQVLANRNDAAVAAAVAGLGIVATTRAGCRAELESGALLELLTEWDRGSIDVHAVCVGGRAAKLSATAFVEFLIGALNPLHGMRVE